MTVISFFRGVALAASVVLVPLPAAAQVDFSGTWALNSAASDLGGLRPPRSDVLTIRHLGERFVWSEIIVMSDGSIEREAWDGATDGVARPVSGAPGSSASYRADGSGRWMSSEGDADLLATLSADGQQFILTSTSSRPDGKTLKQTFVYDRQKENRAPRIIPRPATD